MNYPNTLNIFLTEECNLRCRYCFINREGSSNKELNLEALKKGINHFIEFPDNNKAINFNGGEPLLRFGKLKTIYAYARKACGKDTRLVCAVVNNGTLLNEKHYDFLRNNGILLQVSIDGMKKIHDYNRPFKRKDRGSSFKKIVNNIKKLKKTADKKCCNLVFTPREIGSLLGNIKFLWKTGFDYIDFNPELYARWSETELDRLETVFKEFTEFYLGIFRSEGSKKNVFANFQLKNFVNESELFRPTLCRKVNLGMDGNFYSCNKVFSLPESARKEFVIGDINRGIDNQARLRILDRKRKEITRITGKDCGSCKYLKYCFCPVGHYIYFSSKGLDFKKYFPQFCRISQIYIRNFLEIKKQLMPHPLFAKTYCHN